MRDIRFRFWDAKEDKWLGKDSSYWKELTFEDCRKKLIASMRQGNIVAEQYTGLKDKNGKEVYEGDIVEEDIDFNSKMTDGTFRYKVYWNEDELCWSLDPISQESIHNDLWELNSSCRVIGNIHETPKDFRPEHLKRMGISISKGGEE